MDKIKINKQFSFKENKIKNQLCLQNYSSYYYKSYEEILLEYSTFTDKEKRKIFNSKKDPGVLIFVSANRDTKILKYFLDEAKRLKIDLTKSLSCPYEIKLTSYDLQIYPHFTCANIALISQNENNYNLLKEYDLHDLFIESDNPKDIDFLSFLISPNYNLRLKKEINIYNADYTNNEYAKNIKEIIEFIVEDKNLKYNNFNYSKDILNQISKYGSAFCFGLLLNNEVLIQKENFKNILISLIRTDGNYEYINIFFKYNDFFNFKEKKEVLESLEKGSYNNFEDQKEKVKILLEKDKLKNTINFNSKKITNNLVKI